MGLFEHFPYTNFHDLNLEWILREIKDLRAKIIQVENDFNDKIKDYQSQLDAAIKKLTDADLDLQDQINANYKDLSQQIYSLNIRHDRDIINLSKQMGENLDLAYAYTDQEVAKVKALIEYPLLPNVFNIFKQAKDSIDSTLSDYYRYLRPHSYSAGWFDRCGITWAEIQALDKTPLEWDLEGKHIIQDYFKTDARYMFSPFTGEKVLVKEVVMALANYHLTGRTVGEWDELDYTWTDLATLTPYQIDWTRDPVPYPGT